jgi:DNA-binding transcriptional ArsR family regulator
VARETSKGHESSKAKNSRYEEGGKPPSHTREAARRVAHAVMHSARLDALSILLERTTSPKEIARALQIPLSTASFHVKELFADGAIELVRTEPRRGAVEHYYRAVVTPEVSDEEWRAMPKSARREGAATLLTAIIAEGLSSLHHGCMDADDDLYLLWVPMQLTAEGRRETYELQAEMHDRIEAVKAKDRERQSEADADLPVRVVALMGFDRSRAGRPDGDALGRGRGS